MGITAWQAAAGELSRREERLQSCVQVRWREPTQTCLGNGSDRKIRGWLCPADLRVVWRWRVAVVCNHLWLGNLCLALTVSVSAEPSPVRPQTPHGLLVCSAPPPGTEYKCREFMIVHWRMSLWKFSIKVTDWNLDRFGFGFGWLDWFFSLVESVWFVQFCLLCLIWPFKIWP